MSIEAMRQALDALGKLPADAWLSPEAGIRNYEAMSILRQAIEQAEKQEPVAYIDSNTIEWFLNPKRGKDSVASPILTKKPSLYCDTPLYTAPPPIKFPVALRKMWTGAEVQQWLDEHVNGGNHA